MHVTQCSLLLLLLLTWHACVACMWYQYDWLCMLFLYNRYVECRSVQCQLCSACISSDRVMWLVAIAAGCLATAAAAFLGCGRACGRSSSDGACSKSYDSNAAPSPTAGSSGVLVEKPIVSTGGEGAMCSADGSDTPAVDEHTPLLDAQTSCCCTSHHRTTSEAVINTSTMQTAPDQLSASPATPGAAAATNSSGVAGPRAIRNMLLKLLTGGQHVQQAGGSSSPLPHWLISTRQAHQLHQPCRLRPGYCCTTNAFSAWLLGLNLLWWLLPFLFSSSSNTSSGLASAQPYWLTGQWAGVSLARWLQVVYWLGVHASWPCVFNMGLALLPVARVVGWAPVLGLRHDQVDGVHRGAGSAAVMWLTVHGE